MIYDISMNNIGDITGEPRNRRVAAKIAKHMEEMTGNYEATFFIQDGIGTDEFMEDLPKDKARDLSKGWDISINADPWIYAHYYGWDCHTLFE